MQLNKILILLILLLSVIQFNTLAQPDANRYIYQMGLVFNKCERDEIAFHSKDSVYFVSENRKYRLHFELINQTSKPYDTLLLKVDKSDIDNAVYEIKSYTNIFSIKQNHLTTIEGNVMFKSFLKISLSKRNRKMIIYVDFTTLQRNVELKNLHIYFKQGTYEINNPENPKLIPIKKGRE